MAYRNKLHLKMLNIKTDLKCLRYTYVFIDFPLFVDLNIDLQDNYDSASY